MSDRHDTTPGIPAVGAPPAGTGPVSGSGAHAYPAEENHYTAPQYTTQPVAVRRPDVLAGLLLLLAGGAAAVSLFLDWLPGKNITGLDLVRDGFSAFARSTGNGFSSGLWQPLMVILGGGVLALLGLLLFVPARSHRFLGALALVVTLGIVAAILVPLAKAQWDFGQFDTGFWFAIAVAGLGLLGSLTALATGRKYGTASSTFG
jgi:hypothetical protein